MTHRAPSRVGRLAGLWLLACLGLSCGEPSDPGEPTQGASLRGRVLLIGIDGASPALTSRLVEQGRLPNLAMLAERGAHGRVRALLPIESPPIWNTIATGKLPERHGIEGFARVGPGGRKRLYLGTDRRVHALWNIVSDAGGRVGVVNFWNTYPPELVQGVMISDHLMPREIEGRREMSGAGAVPQGPVAHPLEWRDRAATIVAEATPLTAIENPLTDPALPSYLTLAGDDLPRRFGEDGALARIALEIEREIHPDLLMVLLPGVDRVSHFLWNAQVEDQTRYIEGLRLNDTEREAGQRALARYYEYVDALVGLLVAPYSENDLIVVLSDHGFEPGRGLGILTGVHEGEAALDGIVYARGPGIAPGSKIEGFGVADVTPTLLAWLGLPVGDDMTGRVAPFVGPTDPARIPSHDTSPVARLPYAPSGAESEIVEQLETLGYIE